MASGPAFTPSLKGQAGTPPPILPPAASAEISKIHPSSVAASHQVINMGSDNYEVVLRIQGNDIPLTKEQWKNVASDLGSVVERCKEQLDSGEKLTFSAEKLSGDKAKISSVKEGKKANVTPHYKTQQTALKVLNTVAVIENPKVALTRVQQLEARVKTLEDQKSTLEASNTELQRDEDTLLLLHEEMERLNSEHQNALKEAYEEGRQEVAAEMERLLGKKVSEEVEFTQKEALEDLNQQRKEFDVKIQDLTKKVASEKAALAGLELSNKKAMVSLKRAQEEAIAALQRQHEEALAAARKEVSEDTLSFSGSDDTASSITDATAELEEQVKRLETAAKGHEKALAKVNVEADRKIAAAEKAAHKKSDLDLKRQAQVYEKKGFDKTIKNLEKRLAVEQSRGRQAVAGLFGTNVDTEEFNALREETEDLVTEIKESHAFSDPESKVQFYAQMGDLFEAFGLKDPIMDIKLE